jgi:hypothetical protein
VPQERLRTVERPGQVRLHDHLPVADVHLRRRRLALDAGAVDENVHGPEAADDVAQQAVHGVRPRDVHRPGEDPLPRALRDRLSRLAERPGVPRRERDVGSGFRQRDRRRAA